MKDLYRVESLEELFFFLIKFKFKFGKVLKEIFKLNLIDKILLTFFLSKN
jgi:hypothetical protein